VGPKLIFTHRLRGLFDGELSSGNLITDLKIGIEMII